MRKLLIGCAVACLIALVPRTEARISGTLISVPQPVPETRRVLGVASWYGSECSGNFTASGELYDFNGLTAAHRTLPLGTIIRVTNLGNNRSVVLRVNDRGPSITDRLVDVSQAAAKRLGFLGAGLTKVEVEVLSDPRPDVRTITPPTPAKTVVK